MGTVGRTSRGHKRSNDTHESRLDTEAKLLKKGKGKESKLCFAGHGAMENRNGLCVLFEVTPSVGVTETEQALGQIDELCMRGFNPVSAGADSNYHTASFVSGCRDRGIAPHVAFHSARKTPGLDGRTRRSGAYKASQKVRKKVEEIFG